jgi:DNA-binding CsgD family transcriptional regulator
MHGSNPQRKRRSTLTRVIDRAQRADRFVCRLAAGSETSSARVVSVEVEPSGDFKCEDWLESTRISLQAQAAILLTPDVSSSAWDVGSCLYVGPTAEIRRSALRRWLRNPPESARRPQDYDSVTIDPRQRDRAFSLRELCALDRATRSRLEDFCRMLALPQTDLLCILVCHGSRLLACVGILREEAFDAADRVQFEALVGSLRQGVIRQRDAGTAPMHRPLLEFLLELVPEPALVLSAGGWVEHANSTALDWLRGTEASDSLSALREALERGETHPEFVVSALDDRGCPGYRLVLRRKAQRGTSDAVVRASHLWQLRPRQIAVLEHVAMGRSNKEVAAALGCAEVTVERYLTSLFRVSGSQSRTELIARVYELRST